MTSHGIFIELPEALYERLHQTAEQGDISIESTLVDTLSLFYGLPISEKSFVLLNNLSDEQLWTLINQRLSIEENERLDLLMEEVKKQPLPDNQQVELDMLVKKINRQMLIRSKALVLLNERGHNVDSFIADIE